MAARLGCIAERFTSGRQGWCVIGVHEFRALQQTCGRMRDARTEPRAAAQDRPSISGYSCRFCFGRFCLFSLQTHPQSSHLPSPITHHPSPIRPSIHLPAITHHPSPHQPDSPKPHLVQALSAPPSEPGFPSVVLDSGIPLCTRRSIDDSSINGLDKNTKEHMTR